MLRIKGIYDGQKVVLTEPISLPPNTAVEVLIAEPENEREQLYHQQLVKLGLLKERPEVAYEATPYTPIQVSGGPLSQTIIEDRS
jgi:hypothetical protein